MDKVLSVILSLLTKKIFVLFALLMAFVISILSWYKDTPNTLINAGLFYVFVFIPIIIVARDKS